MAEQILPSFVGKVVDYLADLVGRQLSYLFCYHRNLEEFKKQLSSLEVAEGDVKLLVDDAKRKGEDIMLGVENWLTRVNGITDESKRFVEEEDAISKCCFNGPPNLIVRYRRSRKAKKKALELDAIKKEARLDSVAVPALPLPIGSMSNENEFDFESRRLVFSQIVDAIKDDEVGIIGIWGMPGIGKTTLVNRVGKYAKDEGLFRMVPIAVVSQEPSIRDIQGQIADKLGFKFTNESQEGRADQLFKRLLEEKKILVILDDIWDSLELNVIGIPSGSQHKGCKIILTSRKENVCKDMGVKKEHIFKIDLLGEDEARSLFLHTCVDDISTEKKDLVEDLCQACDRLPIAIVLVARGLLNRDLNDWKDMLNRLRNSDPDDRLYKIIKSSYDYLGRKEEKWFFLLCALFPEDYEIPVQVLFEYGLGLNLFERVDNVDEALVRAHKLASSLKSSSLLLNGKSKEIVKMHDVVRDVAFAIAFEENHAFVVGSTARWREWRGKKAISLWSNYIKKFPDAFEFPKLQILMLKCSHPDLELHDNFFVGKRNLLVLDMSGMEFVRLPESIAGLENLLTLRLSDCKLGDISAIGKLQNLVSLSFYNSNIEVLPKEVGELSNLRLLDLSACETLKVITPGVIQNLSQLEVLRVGGSILWSDEKEVCQPENASLSELIHLSRLMILEIWIPDASMLPDEVLFENLTKFEVLIGRDVHKHNFIDCPSSQILMLSRLSENVLSKSGIKMLMKKAQRLILNYISSIFVALPSDLGRYGSLKEVILMHCDNVNYVLDMNESEFPSLQHLHLENLPQLREITRGQFPMMLVCKLEHLRLFRLPRLFRLWPSQAESVALANLTTMRVKSCNELKYFFEQSTAKSCLKLRELDVGDCTNLQTIYMSKEEEHDEVIDLPQLSHLKLWRQENLASFSSKFTSESTLLCKQKVEKIWHILTPVESFFQLKVMELKECPQLLSIFPPQSTSSLQNLEELCIEDCCLLETLFQSDGVPLAEGEDIILFPRLITLRLVNLPNFTAILSTTSPNISQATVSFPILKSIHVRKLNRMKNIWHDKVSAKCFGQLQQLHVSYCDQLVEVFPGRLIPNLHCLEEVTIQKCNLLEKLFQLDYCSVGENKTMTILKRLKILNLEVMPEFRQIWWIDDQRLCGVKVLLGRLSHLKLAWLDLMEEIWHPEHPATTVGELSILEVKCCDKLSKIFPSNLLQGLQNLAKLHVESCESLEHVFAVEDHPPFLSNLEELELYNLPKLKQLWWNENTYESFGLPRLRTFWLLSCSALRFVFDASVANHLENLEYLYVENCSSIVEIAPEKPGEKIVFPLLAFLFLRELPCFKGFNESLVFPQAEYVFVDPSFNMKELRQNKKQFPQSTRFIQD